MNHINFPVQLQFVTVNILHSMESIHNFETTSIATSCLDYQNVEDQSKEFLYSLGDIMNECVLQHGCVLHIV